MTARGFAMPKGLSYDDWLGIGRRLAAISNASAWWLGDWVVYGEQTFGQRYRSALEATSLDYQTLRNYAWVARRFPPARRCSALSLQHHVEVAALPEPEQDLWLRRAERGHWSRNKLRRELSAHRRSREMPASDATVVCRIEVGAGRQHRWQSAAAASEQPFTDWIVA